MIQVDGVDVSCGIKVADYGGLNGAMKEGVIL